LNIDDIIRCFL